MSNNHETQPLLPESNRREQRSSRQRCLGKLSSFTIEPCYLLHILASHLYNVPEAKLWIDKTCRNHFNLSEAVCDNLHTGSYPHEQNEVQQQVNRYWVYCSVIRHVPTLVMVLLMGCWSDARSRRLPLLLPFTGYFLMCGGYAINAYCFWLKPEFMLLCPLVLGLMGGPQGLELGLLAYVSHTSSDRSRASRISTIWLIAIAASIIGKGASLPLLQSGDGYSGYIKVFLTSTILNALAILYVLARLEDKPGGAAPPVPGIPPKLTIYSTVMVVTKRREQGKRMFIWVHMILLWSLLFFRACEDSQYLYTRKKFGWAYQDYIYWTIVDSCSGFIGNGVVVPLLSYKWQVRDEVLGLLGCVSLMISYMLRAVAPTSWILYLAVACGFCSGMIGLSSRAALSRLVHCEELGGVFGVMVAGRAVVPMLSGPVFAFLYNATIKGFPGTVYAVSAVGCALLAAVYAQIYVTEVRRPPPPPATSEQLPHHHSNQDQH